MAEKTRAAKRLYYIDQNMIKISKMSKKWKFANSIPEGTAREALKVKRNRNSRTRFLRVQHGKAVIYTNGKPTNRSINRSTDRSTDQSRTTRTPKSICSINRSINRSLNPSINPSINPSESSSESSESSFVGSEGRVLQIC